MKIGIKTQEITNGHVNAFEQVPCNGDTKGVKNVNSRLSLALKLGNTFKSKCKLVINTTLGKKTVHGTIWDVTDDHVELSGGTKVLIACIEDIKLV